MFAFARLYIRLMLYGAERTHPSQSRQNNWQHPGHHTQAGLFEARYIQLDHHAMGLGDTMVEAKYLGKARGSVVTTDGSPIISTIL